jgi:hypothetical protein
MPAMSSNAFDLSRMEKGVNSVLGISSIGSLLADDDNDNVPSQGPNGLAEGVKHLHMETNGDGFPLLRRRDTDVDQDDRHAIGLSTIHRHRAGQQSLPWNTLRHSQHEDVEDSVFTSPGRKNHANNRRSMEVYSSSLGTQSKRSSMHSTNGYVAGGVPKLQQSYSTNDIPTVKNLHESNSTSGASMTHAEQHLHNHNASMGRVPLTASNRQSRDFSILEPRGDETSAFAMPSALQANAPSFQGPTSHLSNLSATSPSLANGSSTYVPNNGFYNSYNMPIVNAGSSNSTYTGAQNSWHNNGYGAQFQNYNGIGTAYARPPFPIPDSQRTVIRNRKGEDG